MNDYLEHYNHNHDALGRFARSAGSASSAVGSKLTSRKKEKSNITRKYESTQRLTKKKTKASEAVVKSKQKGSKSNNTKLSDSERRRLVDHGSLKEITKNKDKLSNRELESAINRLQKEKISRIDLEKKLSDLNTSTSESAKKTTLEKIEQYGKNAQTVANALESGVKLYNISANIYNRGKPEGQRLPRIGDNSGGNKTRPWVKSIIDSGDPAKASKYINQMTSDERKQVYNSIKNKQNLEDLVGAGTKSNNSSGSVKESKPKDKTPTHQSFFQEKQTNTKPESWGEVREKDIPKMKETIQTRSENRANNILSKYQDYPTGTFQKNTSEVKERVAETKNTSVEELKKKKQGYGKYLRED